MKFRIVFLLLLLSGLTAGCAGTTADFGGMYNEALQTGRNRTVFKDGDFERIKDEVNDCLETAGYTKVMYSRPEQGFMVLVKDIPAAQALVTGDPHPYKIILKYTNAGTGRTRIDLVNASTVLSAEDDVDRDIAKLAEKLR